MRIVTKRFSKCKYEFLQIDLSAFGGGQKKAQALFAVSDRVTV